MNVLSVLLKTLANRDPIFLELYREYERLEGTMTYANGVSIGARLCAAAARAAPRAEKQLAPQFCLLQFTGFYKYLKLLFSNEK